LGFFGQKARIEPNSEIRPIPKYDARHRTMPGIGRGPQSGQPFAPQMQTCVKKKKKKKKKKGKAPARP